MTKIRSVLFILAFFGMLLAVSAETKTALWGAKAAASDANPSIEAMLRYAIEDEYLARAEYEAIIKKFGSQRPFSNIIKSEESHIAWIKEAYTRLSLPVPADTASTHVVIPSTLDEAFKTGVQAEIDNIAMYDHFLKTNFIKNAANVYYRDLFVRLRDASKNHLAAFKKGA
jgi:hypothetical protein